MPRHLGFMGFTEICVDVPQNSVQDTKCPCSMPVTKNTVFMTIGTNILTF